MRVVCSWLFDLTYTVMGISVCGYGERIIIISLKKNNEMKKKKIV